MVNQLFFCSLLAFLAATSAVELPMQINGISGFMRLEKDERDDIDFFFDAGSTGVKMFANPALHGGDKKWTDMVAKAHNPIESSGEPNMDIKNINHAATTACGDKATPDQCKKYLEPIREKMKEMLEKESLGRKKAKCMVAATAGNRPKPMEYDNKAWKLFFDEMTKDDFSCEFTLLNGQKVSSWATVPGTQEALYEAYVALSFTPDDKTEKQYGNSMEFGGFITSGGASAQVGFHLCTDEVADAWAELMKDEKGTEILNSQCHLGTDQKLWNYVAWSTIDNIKKADGSDLADFDQAKFDTACKGGARKCWALGSLLQCPDAGGVDVPRPEDAMDTDNTSPGVGGYLVTLGGMQRYVYEGGIKKREINIEKFHAAQEKHSLGTTQKPYLINADKTAQMFAEDGFVKHLATFFKAFNDGDCLNKKLFAMAFASDNQALLTDETKPKAVLPGLFPLKETSKNVNQLTYQNSKGKDLKYYQLHPDYVGDDEYGCGNIGFKVWSDMYAWGWKKALGLTDLVACDGKKPNTPDGCKLVGVRGVFDWGPKLGAYTAAGTDVSGPKPDPATANPATGSGNGPPGNVYAGDLETLSSDLFALQKLL